MRHPGSFSRVRQTSTNLNGSHDHQKLRKFSSVNSSGKGHREGDPITEHKLQTLVGVATAKKIHDMYRSSRGGGHSRRHHHRHHRTNNNTEDGSSKGRVNNNNNEGSDEDKLDDINNDLSEENHFICSECRSQKIDTHLMTLKKLREKALRYTNQLDEIRAATKKREKELTDVMERLQVEEKHLHEQLENVDHLSFKMNTRRNQLRQDQMSLQQEENQMAQRLQALKEKEIFVNCQMVKLQSQEGAIKHRERELQKEKLRIEKLAYLLFQTDLSTMTYKEFHNRVETMQHQLEKRYRKLKVIEHYCQHKSLPVGMKLEPVTPIEQVAASFDEVLWREKDEGETGTPYSDPSVHLFRRDSTCKPKVDAVASYRYKPSGGRVSSKSQVMSGVKIKHQNRSLPTKEKNYHRQLVDLIKAGNRDLARALFEDTESTQTTEVSQVFITSLKSSKSEQRHDRQRIVRQAESQLERLVMSAKETSSSAKRVLEKAFIPRLDKETVKRERNSPPTPPQHCSNNSFQSNPEEEDGLIPEDYDQDDVQDKSGSGSESYTTVNDEIEPSSNSEGEVDDQEIVDETEIIHKRICQIEPHCPKNLPAKSLSVDKGENKKEDDIIHKNSVKQNEWNSGGLMELDNPVDENGVCSLYRNAKNNEEKVSSQCLLQPESGEGGMLGLPFKYRFKKSSEESMAEGAPGVITHNSSGDVKPLKGRWSNDTKLQKNDDRLDHYEEIVSERLSRLSETTRNEIVYAIGHKALAQVAQAMELSKKSASNTKHGDQGSATTATASLKKASATSQDNKSLKVRSKPPRNKTSCDHHSSPENYVQPIVQRRSMKNLEKKIPRKIPSHLKFGNFNIRRRSRKTNETYRTAESLSSDHKMMLHETESCSKSRTSGDMDIPNEIRNLCDIQERNFSAGVVAEKILGIHPLATSTRWKESHHKPTPKISHTRAFRV